MDCDDLLNLTRLFGYVGQEGTNSIVRLPSGKHTKNYGRPPFLMGKSAINGPFLIAKS